jgi:hypothetical protein
MVEKVGSVVKEREERSGIVMNYYKRKFLKYKCRKSIELETTRTDTLAKPNRRDEMLLADGLKIEKIEIAEAPKAHREIFNKAKFNTIAEETPRRGRRWEIGPWLMSSDA